MERSRAWLVASVALCVGAGVAALTGAAWLALYYRRVVEASWWPIVLGALWYASLSVREMYREEWRKLGAAPENRDQPRLWLARVRLVATTAAFLAVLSACAWIVLVERVLR